MLRLPGTYRCDARHRSGRRRLGLVRGEEGAQEGLGELGLVKHAPPLLRGPHDGRLAHPVAGVRREERQPARLPREVHDLPQRGGLSAAASPRSRVTGGGPLKSPCRKACSCSQSSAVGGRTMAHSRRRTRRRARRAPRRARARRGGGGAALELELPLALLGAVRVELRLAERELGRGRELGKLPRRGVGLRVRRQRLQRLRREGLGARDGRVRGRIAASAVEGSGARAR